MSDNNKTDVKEVGIARKRHSIQEGFNVIREVALSLKDKETTTEEAEDIITETSSFLKNLCIIMFEKEIKEELLTTDDVRRFFEFIKIKKDPYEKNNK